MAKTKGKARRKKAGKTAGATAGRGAKKGAGRVRSVPDGFHTVSAYLVVPNAVEAMAWYAKALGARSVMRMPGSDGRSTMHAEMRLGDSTFMLTDENPKWEMKSPSTLGGSPASLHLYVENVDAAFQRAVAAGAQVRMPVADMFWGDRYGKLVDPYGFQWGIATHKEDLKPAEIGRRAADYFAKLASGQSG